MKLWVEPDEFWPWFNLSRAPDQFSDGIDVDDEIAIRWEAALGAAITAQREIREAVGWDI